MSGPSAQSERVRLDGKFFRLGDRRFVVRGVTYGTFGANEAGEPFPEPARARQDLDLIRELGANTLRIYAIPPPWFREAVVERGLRLLVTLPWAWQSCFLDSERARREARTSVTAAVRTLAGHPCLFAYALANEIPSDVIRWSGAPRVAGFLDDLVAAAHDLDPACLCTYANYPTTEYLQPRHLDFLMFNVFLHRPEALDDYLARLQGLADGRPLILGECGADSRREGPEGQARIVAGNLDIARRAGLAGAVVFSFTDDWVRGGQRVEDWEMGLTTAAREPKPAFAAVRERFHAPDAFPVPDPAPRVSVVVASYNGAATLRACVDSLLRLDYPDYEVIVVDDGSTDDTLRITATFPHPRVRTLRHATNEGLSTARNLGWRAATGDIIAYLDADCRADADWLKYLVEGLVRLRVAGIGGPNLLPPDDSPVAASVMASPGGPAHVLFDDRYAEHLPGCNMAFWRWALEAIGGFDPVFRQAGDDVDVCWRILREGWKLGFVPAAQVWHHRRSTVRDYLRQQAGYGAAEALLVNKHPERFNAIGGARWQGRICHSHGSPPRTGRSVIYHGTFATASFQTLYTPPEGGLLPLLCSLEYHVVVVLPLLLLALGLPWLWPLPVAAFLLPPIQCIAAAARAILPRDRRRGWSRALIAWLHWIQPVVRGAARYRARFSLRTQEPHGFDSLEARARVYAGHDVGQRAYWSARWRDRRDWVARIMDGLENQCWPFRADAGWSEHDLEIFGARWARVTLVTVAEANADTSQTLRCRLRVSWTLSAHLAFWSSALALAVVVAVFQVGWRGWWIPALLLLVLAGYLRAQGRGLQARLSVLLDAVAREWDLTPLTPPASKPS